MRPKVAAVVLNWKGYHHTQACVASLGRITYPNCHVVIVDNGSADGSAERLTREFPEASVIANEANLGFSGGCNVGMRHALEQGADYVLLINNDCVVEPGFLEPAVTLMESDPEVGLVSGKIYLRDHPGQIWYAGGQVSRWRGFPTMTGYRQADRGQFDRPREIGFAAGTLMLIGRRVLETVGLLGEEYFFGGEDWDYSVAVKRAGFTLYYVPDFVVHHTAGGSHSGADARYLYSSYRARLIFQQKYLPPTIFRLWKRLLSLYSVGFVKWRFARRGAANSTAFSFALKSAIEDHSRKATLGVTEQELHDFERRFGVFVKSREGGSDTLSPAHVAGES